MPQNGLVIVRGMISERIYAISLITPLLQILTSHQNRMTSFIPNALTCFSDLQNRKRMEMGVKAIAKK